jgi:hypothetical protein
MVLSLEQSDEQPWFKYVEPKDGESIASFCIGSGEQKAIGFRLLVS